MSIFAPMVATLFEGPLAQDATYQPFSGSPFAVRVIPTRPDDTVSAEGLEIIQQTTAFDVMKSAVPSPQKGDQIILDGETIKIRHWKCLDDERLIWTLFK